MLKTLEKRAFPAGKVTVLASARSLGKRMRFAMRSFLLRN